MKWFKKMALGVLNLVSLLAVSCSVIYDPSLLFDATSLLKYGYEYTFYTFEKNDELRCCLEKSGLTVFLDPNEQKAEYNQDDFLTLLPNEVYGQPVDPVSNFDDVEEEGAHNTTYQVTELCDEAALYANKVLENDDDILGWQSPSFSEDESGFSYNNQGNPDKAIVWLTGGPLGDVPEGEFMTASYLFGEYGTVFVLNESQYGFIPQEVVYENEDYYTNDEESPIKDEEGYVEIKGKIQKESLSSLEAIKVLMEDLDLLNIEAFLAASLALSKIDADRTAWIYDQLLDYEYEEIYLVGFSHGFNVGLDAILFNEQNLVNYDAIVVENNLLAKTQEDSLRMSGGLMSEDDLDTFEGNSGSGVDTTLYYSRLIFKHIYGYIDILEYKMEEEEFLVDLQEKVFFKFALNDWNIGNPTTEELDFYFSNGLNLEIKYNGGHNATASAEEYEKIFNSEG